MNLQGANLISSMKECVCQTQHIKNDLNENQKKNRYYFMIVVTGMLIC
jgi:hypothetical protein